MKTKLLQTCFFCILIIAGVVEAQASDNYNLTWNVIGGGGGSSDSSNYKLNSTIGQSAIGFSNDTSYNMSSGYWYGLAQPVVGIHPAAILGADKLGCENVGTPVQFNGSASYDPDGTIVEYYWDFGDGTNVTGAEPKHTYNAYKWDGTSYNPFRVNLTVTDNSGLTNSSLQNVIIWIAGNANNDGTVNILDASVVGLKWGGNDPCANLNNDATVNILDASIIGLNWGKNAVN